MNEHPTISDIQANADKMSSTFDRLKLGVLGPRADAAVRSKLNLYVSIVALVIAFNLSCVAQRMVNWTIKNTRVYYVYMDPSGSGTLVEAYAPGEQPPFREVDLKSRLWDATKKQFEVFSDTAAKNEGDLVDYFFTGDAALVRQKSSNNEQDFGSAAEKRAIIASGRERDLELREIRWKVPPVREKSSWVGTVEVLFYARTRTAQSQAPGVRRAYRVEYAIVAGGEVVPGKDPASQKLFLLHNPLLLRINRFRVEPEFVGAIPETPDQEAQIKAMSPDGALVEPPMADGGIAAKPVESPR